MSNGSCGRFLHADVHRGHAGGRAIGGGHHAIVTQELNDLRAFNEGDAVVGAVLNSVGGISEPGGSESALLMVESACQGVAGIKMAARTVVENQGVVGEDGTGFSGDFNAFVRVVAGIVVMNFIDPKVFGAVGVDDPDR